MNEKAWVSVFAALLLVNACGNRVGAWQEPVRESAPMAVDVADVPSSTDSVHPSPTTTSTVVSADGESGPSDSASDEIQPAADPISTSPTTSSTTTTTSASPSSIGLETTTTQPAIAIDLHALNEALRELDELLGLFDSHVDSVDLDDTEGETP